MAAKPPLVFLSPGKSEKVAKHNNELHPAARFHGQRSSSCLQYHCLPLVHYHKCALPRSHIDLNMAGVAVIEPEGRINEVNIEGLVSFGGVFFHSKSLGRFLLLLLLLLQASHTNI